MLERTWSTWMTTVGDDLVLRVPRDGTGTTRLWIRVMQSFDVYRINDYGLAIGTFRQIDSINKSVKRSSIFRCFNDSFTKLSYVT